LTAWHELDVEPIDTVHGVAHLEDDRFVSAAQRLSGDSPKMSSRGRASMVSTKRDGSIGSLLTKYLFAVVLPPCCAHLGFAQTEGRDCETTRA
jgi:hypothetical protein